MFSETIQIALLKKQVTIPEKLKQCHEFEIYLTISLTYFKVVALYLVLPT